MLVCCSETQTACLTISHGIGKGFWKLSLCLITSKDPMSRADSITIYFPVIKFSIFSFYHQFICSLFINTFIYSCNWWALASKTIVVGKPDKNPIFMRFHSSKFLHIKFTSRVRVHFFHLYFHQSIWYDAFLSHNEW